MGTLEKLTDDDTFLMEDAMEAGFSGKALSAINRCQVHIRATTRSDLGQRSIHNDALEVRLRG